MNQVNLIGNLTKDVLIFSDGQVAKFTLAINKRDKDGKNSADFINCVAFSKTAEILSNYTKKGDKIGLTGRIQTGSYTNKDGQLIYTTDVVVSSVYFLQKSERADNVEINEDDLPF